VAVAEAATTATQLVALVATVAVVEVVIKMPVHRGMLTVSINKLAEFMPMPDKTILEAVVVEVVTADQIHTDLVATVAPA
jgi:hypothetical protein